MSIEELMQQKKIGVVYILARYFYRIGEPVISDSLYDRIEKFLRENQYELFKEYLERTYDDDPVPTEFLDLIGVKPIVFTPPANSDLYDYLNEDKSFSIESVTRYEDAYPFFERLKRLHLDFVISLKVDGVNTKLLYDGGKFTLSLSRGRASADSFDYTENSAKILPTEIPVNDRMLKLVGESFVVDEGLSYLREKYGKPDGYVSGKSSAISLLRVNHERVDYQYLKTKLFYAENLADTLEETFIKLKEMGFDVVPFKKLSWEDIPNNLEEFKQWAKVEIFDYIWEAGKGIPSDGVVVEVNDLTWVGEQHNQYVSRQLALKFEQWFYKIYKGIVKDIKIEQRRVNKSVRVEIEPLTTSDGNKAKVINTFNPSILIKNDLRVGKIVYFERNSNAFNSVIYGERLKDILADDNIEVIGEEDIGR